MIVGRPKHGRSTSRTTARCFTLSRPPQPGQAGRGVRVLIVTSNQSSVTSRMLTSGKPISSSHMRIESDVTGALPNLVGVEHRQILRAPVSRPGYSSTNQTPLRSEEPVSPRRISRRKAQDKSLQVGGGGWSSWWSSCSGPVSGDAPSVPPKQCVGCDDPPVASCSRE